MKLVIATPLLALVFLGGCASSPTVPTGMKAGEFVTYSCEGGKRFQARVAPGGESVRLRYEGGYELDRKEAGIYEAEGWKLVTQGPAVQVFHNGKPTLQNCKVA